MKIIADIYENTLLNYPEKVFYWCKQKSNALLGLNALGQKLDPDVDPRPLSFLAASFLRGVGKGISTFGFAGEDKLPVAAYLVFAGAVVGTFVASYMAAAVLLPMILPGISALGGAVGAIPFLAVGVPLIHTAAVATLSLVTASCNALTSGVAGAAFLVGKPFYQRVVPAEQVAAQPAAPVLDDTAVMTYIKALPDKEQDALMHNLRDSFPALIERTIEANIKKAPVYVAQGQNIVAPRITFGARPSES